VRGIVWAALAGAAMMSAATLAVSLATTQSQPQIDWCVNVAHRFSLDQQISGCTVAIQSRRWRGQELAWAFNNRGFAYYRKGYLDPAFADFEQAIRLDPKDAVAFNNRGLIYQAKGDLDRAIADYNETIRLDPTYIFAFNNRGGAYQGKNDYDRAIADYSEAIRLNPEYVVAFINRGNAYQLKVNLDRAIADYNEAIRLDPKESGMHLNRGLANLCSGSQSQALADLNQSSEFSPNHAYAALWRDIVARRSNLPSRLAQAMTQIDMTKWPAPVIRLYLGQMTPESVLAAADDPDANTKKVQICEANFFIGELALQRGSNDEAVRLFRLAAADCGKNTYVSAHANAELRMLGAQP